jgi:hypothetical protein
MSGKRLAIISLLVLCAVPAALAAAKPVELRWNELASVIQGQRAEVMLADGTGLKGEVIAVREDALVMDVKKVTAGRHEKGSATVERNSIGLIKLERSRGSIGRTAGTIVGVISGVVLGGWAAAHTESASAGIPTFLGIASGVSVAGIYAGRALDRESMLIKVVP